MAGTARGARGVLLRHVGQGCGRERAGGGAGSRPHPQAPSPDPVKGGGLPGRPEGMSTGNGWRMSLGWACLGFGATDSSENPASQGEGVEGHAHIGRRIRTSGVPQRGPPAMGQVHVTGIPPSTAVGGQDLEAMGPVESPENVPQWALVLNLRLRPARHLSLPDWWVASGPRVLLLWIQDHCPEAATPSVPAWAWAPKATAPSHGPMSASLTSWPGLVGCSSRPPASSLEPPAKRGCRQGPP